MNPEEGSGTEGVRHVHPLSEISKKDSENFAGCSEILGWESIKAWHNDKKGLQFTKAMPNIDIARRNTKIVAQY